MYKQTNCSPFTTFPYHWSQIHPWPMKLHIHYPYCMLAMLRMVKAEIFHALVNRNYKFDYQKLYIFSDLEFIRQNMSRIKYVPAQISKIFHESNNQWCSHLPGLDPSSKICKNSLIFPCLKYSLCIKTKTSAFKCKVTFKSINHHPLLLGLHVHVILEH